MSEITRTPIFHTECGKVAFYWLGEIGPDQALSADRVILLDGTQPKEDDKLVCGSCGDEIFVTAGFDIMSAWSLDIFKI